jgi:hypothetical protein
MRMLVFVRLGHNMMLQLSQSAVIAPSTKSVMFVNDAEAVVGYRYS